MTTTVRRVHQWLVVVIMIGSIAAPPKAMAQGSFTCGWDYLEQQERPPTITRLLDRGPVSEDVRSAARSLDAWFTGCDATAARVAVQSLRRQLGRTNSSDPQLRGLLGIALLRGPEVQVERAEGMTLRSVLEDTNAATEGVRLLSEVAQATGWSEVAEELTLVTVALRKPAHLRTVEAVLRGTVFAGNGRIAALRAEVLLALGAADSAIVAVDGNDHPLARRVSAVAKTGPCKPCSMRYGKPPM